MREADWKEAAVHLQGELELQQLGVAGSSVTEEFGIVWVPLNSLAVMFHGYWVVSYGEGNVFIFINVL